MINENYYELVGTSKQAVEIDYKTNKKRSQEDQDIFIREHYEHTIKLIQMKKDIAKKQERYKDLERLEKQEIKVEEAYKKIETPILREFYNKELEERKKPQMPLIPKERTAYKILDVSDSILKSRTEEEIDILLAKRKDALLRVCEISVTPRNTFVESQRIELERQKILESYELIKTADRRAKYDEQLRIKEEERKRKNEVERIKQTYSHASEYDETLISTVNKEEENLLKKKNIIRTVEEREEYSLMDDEERNLRIKQMAKITCRNCVNFPHEFYEYQVKRIIDGKEKVDNIYMTEISRVNLSINKRTGNKINPGYYNCVANQLLSEEAIEGSKYNGGYIGTVEKDKNGEYYLTIRGTRLIGYEQEMLTATMILTNEINREKNEKGEEECQR